MSFYTLYNRKLIKEKGKQRQYELVKRQNYKNDTKSENDKNEK